MKAKATLILVADAAHARAFRLVGAGPERKVESVFDALHEKRKAQAIMADKPGRSYSSVGSRRSAMEPSTDPVELETRAFVDDIVDELKRSMRSDTADRLVVVAAPRMLGLLRKAYPADLSDSVAGELDKDMMHQTNGEVLDALDKAGLLMS